MLTEVKPRATILKLKTQADKLFHAVQSELESHQAGSVSYTFADFASMPKIDFLPVSPDSQYAPVCELKYGAMIEAAVTAHAKLLEADRIGRDAGLGGIAYAFTPNRIHPMYLFVDLICKAAAFLHELQDYNHIELPQKRHTL
jgi:hypothetical protein